MPVAPKIPTRSLSLIDLLFFQRKGFSQGNAKVFLCVLCEYLRALCVKFLSFTLTISKLHPNDAHPHSTSLHPHKKKSASSLCSRYRMPKRESSLHRVPIQLRQPAAHHRSH